jgi:hypothetical protein
VRIPQQFAPIAFEVLAMFDARDNHGAIRRGQGTQSSQRLFEEGLAGTQAPELLGHATGHRRQTSPGTAREGNRPDGWCAHRVRSLWSCHLRSSCLTVLAPIDAKCENTVRGTTSSNVFLRGYIAGKVDSRRIGAARACIVPAAVTKSEHMAQTRHSEGQKRTCPYCGQASRFSNRTPVPATAASSTSDRGAVSEYKPGWTCENSHCWKRYDFDL